MNRIALGLEYEGGGFQGWQTQPHGLSVQDALEHALSQVAGEVVRTTAVGRTDSGVHALMQIVHFDTQIVRSADNWIRGVNANLPEKVSVRWAQNVDLEFHARFGARDRSYCYVLDTSASRPALNYKKVGWIPQTLDVDSMQQAGALLVGEHDFSAFRAAGCSAKNPRRTLYHVGVAQTGNFIFIEFRANAFLYRMVRHIVAVLVEVGKQKIKPDYFRVLLNEKRLQSAAAIMAADGLYFCGARYGDALPEALSFRRPRFLLP